MIKRNNQPIQFISEEELKDMMECGYRYIQEEYPIKIDVVDLVDYQKAWHDIIVFRESWNNET